MKLVLHKTKRVEKAQRARAIHQDGAEVRVQLMQEYLQRTYNDFLETSAIAEKLEPRSGVLVGPTTVRTRPHARVRT